MADPEPGAERGVVSDAGRLPFHFERKEPEMKYLPLLLILPAPAFAHVGHVTTLDGHDHWLAIGIVGLAGIIGVATALLWPAPDAKEALTPDETGPARTNP